VTWGRSVVFCGYSGFLYHDIAEILLKVVLNTIKLTIKVLCVHAIFLWDC